MRPLSFPILDKKSRSKRWVVRTSTVKPYHYLNYVFGTNEGGWTIPNEGGVCTLVTVVRIPAGKLPNKTAERCIHLVQTSKWIFYYQVQ